MRARNWKEFLLEVTTNFRERFRNEFTSDEKGLFHERIKDYPYSLHQPCQMVVFDFIEPLPIGFLITHNPNHPDLDFYVYEQIEKPKEVKKKVFQEKPFWFEEHKLHDFFKNVRKNPLWLSHFSYDKKTALLLFTEKEARKDPEFIADRLLLHIRGDLGQARARDQIGESTVNLKQDALEITEPEIRAKVLQATEKIEGALRQIKRLDEHEKKLGLIEREIGGVRRLIGVTKEYQDFKVLTSDVDEMKKDYVSRALFVETTKRLDERINGLNTRIDDMKTIRFWSKRTIVDVILGAAAAASTLIAALLATGILQF